MLNNSPTAVPTIDSPSTGYVPDTTAPTLTSSSPANAASGVGNSSAIVATMSEAIASASVNGSTFSLKRTSDNAAVAASLSVSGATLTLTPTSNLAYATGYTATLTTGITDLAGNALAATRTWDFTTQQASTTYSIQIAQDEDDASTLSALSGYFFQSGEWGCGNGAMGGIWEGQPVYYWGLYRFILPAGGIPSGSTVTNTTLTLRGIDNATTEDDWDDTYPFVVQAQKVSNAAQITTANIDPVKTPAQVPLTTASVTWSTGAGPGLLWSKTSDNVTPNLNALVQEVVDSSGGLAGGAAIRFWLRSDRPAQDVGFADSCGGASTGPRLSISFQ